MPPSETALRKTRFALAGRALSALVLCAFAALYVWQSRVAPVLALDEPLWFMRSQVPPSAVSSRDQLFWAVDVPGLNRWAYWAALKASGRDRVPPDEPKAFSLSGGMITFQGAKLPWLGRGLTKKDFESFTASFGAYAPPGAIMLMRTVNLLTFGLCIFGLMWTGHTILQSWPLALIATTPVIISPVFAGDIAFVSWSGDIFMAAFLALTLAVWVWFHVHDRGADWRSVAAVGVLCGLATSSKHPGILAAVAFAAYLAVYSRGAGHVLKPLAACAAAFAVFVLLNPIVVLSQGKHPWTVLAMMVERRGETVAAQLAVYGPLRLTNLFMEKLFWWPILPVVGACFCTCRREKWFAPVLFWSVTITAGHIAAALWCEYIWQRYLAPVEMAVFFPVGAMLMHCALKARTPGKPQ